MEFASMRAQSRVHSGSGSGSAFGLCVRRPLSERLACLGKPVSDTCIVLVVLMDNSPLRLMRTLGERPPGPRIELGGSGLRRGGSGLGSTFRGHPCAEARTARRGYIRGCNRRTG